MSCCLLTILPAQADDPRLLLHTGLPPVQLCTWAVLAGSAFAMPNSVILGYGQARLLREQHSACWLSSVIMYCGSKC